MGGIEMTTKWAMVLDMIRGVAKTCGTGIELTVDPDMSQTITVEACFIIVGVVRREGCSSKITSPVSFTSFYCL